VPLKSQLINDIITVLNLHFNKNNRRIILMIITEKLKISPVEKPSVDKQKLQTLFEKQQIIKNRIASISSRIRSEQDKKLTRKKILIGAYFLEKYKSDESKLSQLLNYFLVRDNDRALFGLSPILKTELVETNNST
jgi:large subunit ribosomal protein L7/L12